MVEAHPHINSGMSSPSQNVLTRASRAMRRSLFLFLHTDFPVYFVYRSPFSFCPSLKGEAL